MKMEFTRANIFLLCMLFVVVSLKTCAAEYAGYFSSRNRHQEPPERTVYVFTKLYNENQIYSVSDNIHSPSLWHQLSGENAQQSDISYFVAYADKWPEYRTWDSWMSTTHDSFDKKMRVCSFTGDFSIIGSKRCNSYKAGYRHGREESSFYVSIFHRIEATKIVYTTCRSGDTIYTRVSTGTVSCDSSGFRLVESGVFYVKNSGMLCSAAQFPANGRISGQSYSSGSKVVQFECNTGYRMLGSPSSTCNKAGFWSKTTPKCTPVKCRKPTAPINGLVSISKSTYLGIATYECNNGYQLSDSQATRQCLDTGKWSGDNIKCSAISCGFPGEVVNGDVHGQDYSFKKKVTFTCDDGYFLYGAKQAICTAVGQWSNQVPECKRIACTHVKPPSNGGIVSGGTESGQSLNFRCRVGYTLVGKKSLNCIERGKKGVWDGQVPVCQIVSCGQPPIIRNGDTLGKNFVYGSEINFACNPGFILEGTDSVTCQRDGSWGGDFPGCKKLQCRHPGTPENGIRKGNSYSFGSDISYKCNIGYILKGKRTISCLETGKWSSQLPTCKVKKCAPLPKVEHGSRSTSVNTYGTDVHFSCYNGYELEGSNTTTCKEDGAWLRPPPVCNACKVGYYKDNTNPSYKCQKCPRYSTTATLASSNRRHCICKKGASGLPGGPCEVVKCKVLAPPTNGRIVKCGILFNEDCHISCEAGYILQGSSLRHCTADGWTGTPTMCTACPDNTYNSYGSSTCLPCPVHSATQGGKPGTSIKSCKCKQGFHESQGGQCKDIDECETNNGGCSQGCENTMGGFTCKCTIPGHVLNDDGKTCKVNRTCKALPRNGNANGYIACTHTARTNGDICRIKCNKGYFFVSGINNYVTCGPDSDFEWSHQLVNRSAVIPACTKEFFVDTKLKYTLQYKSQGLCSAYFDKKSLSRKLQATIGNLEVCIKGNCRIRNVIEICSREPQQYSSTHNVTFHVQLRNLNRDAIPPYCNAYCYRLNMREMLKKTFKLDKSIKSLLLDSPSKFNTNNVTVVQSPPKRSRPELICEEGRVLTSNRRCVPCDAGYYLPSREDKTCLPCPQGTYQAKRGQTKCISCYAGSTTRTEGSSHPVQCNVVVAVIDSQRYGYNKSNTITGARR